MDQRGYSLYIEEHTLRTTKVLRQIGCSVRHFRIYFASPAPSPDRDKTIEFRSIEHLLMFKTWSGKLFSLNRSIWVPKDAKFYTDSNSEGKIGKKRMTKKLFSKNCFFAIFLK